MRLDSGFPASTEAITAVVVSVSAFGCRSSIRPPMPVLMKLREITSTSSERSTFTEAKSSGAPRRSSSIAAKLASEITASRRNSASRSVGVTAFSAAARKARSAAVRTRAVGSIPTCQRSTHFSWADTATTAGKRRRRAASCCASSRGNAAERRIRLCITRVIPSIPSSATVPTRASESPKAYCWRSPAGARRA